MLTYTDLKPGTKIILGGEPYAVLEYNFMRKQQRKPVVQTKIKNLITGGVLEKSFYPRDSIEVAETEMKEMKFLYENRGEFWFCESECPTKRFKLGQGLIAGADFMKQNSMVKASVFNDKIISVGLPIKVDLEVTEAAPAVKGNTAQGVTKQVKLETGATLTVPIFINEGDVVRVNTETGQYTERVLKV